ncbi:hypothetical protein GCM10011328_11400 [Hafnia psychrotolerans]|uniref:Uncharacterized protein n=1 Tax=Hafnia psychrotolerans TaxID=1477018 RepID=A0ABQ1G7Q0_9GAMM|nr:hypothetical protein GCM10011328_11400 [Hafnia psychrotolerans]
MQQKCTKMEQAMFEFGAMLSICTKGGLKWGNTFSGRPAIEQIDLSATRYRTGQSLGLRSD